MSTTLPDRGPVLDGLPQWPGALDPVTRRRLLRLLPLVAMGLTFCVAAERAGLQWKIHRDDFSNDFSPDFDISRLEIRLTAIKSSPTILVWAAPPYIGREWPPTRPTSCPEPRDEAPALPGLLGPPEFIRSLLRLLGLLAGCVEVVLAEPLAASTAGSTARVAAGETQRSVARSYNVSQATISRIAT